MKNRSKNSFNLIIQFLSGAALLFIVAPLIGMYLRVSPNNFFETSIDPEVANSIFLTLWTSMAATLFFSIISIPFAYLLAKKNVPFKNLLNAIIDIPIIIPHSAAGIAILGLIAKDTIIGKTLAGLGLSFVGTPAGIILAMAFVSVPFVLNAARDGFESVPAKLENAALNLGASEWQVFFRVSLPLARRSILSGLILMWARGMSEFGAVIIVAYNPITTPVLIYERFGAFGLKYSTPVAVVFVTICLLFFALFRILGRRK